jgi:predicted nucleic acid-binding Zn ribbon protein
MAKQRPMAKISDVLLKIAKKFDLEIKIVEHTINKNWTKLVGERIASHTKPDTVSYRKLLVYVDSPAWMQQLTFLKEDIIKNINEASGRQIIKDIKFRIGDVAKDASAENKRPDERMEYRLLTKDDLIFADEVTKPIGDDETKGRAKKAVIKYLTAKSKK